jgi:hypothetical protein
LNEVVGAEISEFGQVGADSTAGVVGQEADAIQRVVRAGVVLVAEERPLDRQLG